MLILLTAAALLASTPSMSDPEGVVATAPRGAQSVVVDAEAPTAQVAESTHGLTTQEQIDRWVASRAPAERPFATERDPFAFKDDRKMHGEVTASIGSGDYSSYGARVSLPIGESGRLDISYSQSRNDPYGGYYGGGYYGGGLYGLARDPRYWSGDRYDPFYGSRIVEPGDKGWSERKIRSVVGADEDGPLVR